MKRNTVRQNITVILLLVLGMVACSGSSNASNDQKTKIDPLKYRKELASINIKYSVPEFYKQIEANQKQIVELFLKAGMSSDAEYKIAFGLYDYTPLIDAVNTNKYAIAKLLLKYGANPNKVVRQNHGRSRPENALSVAVSLIKPKYVELLMAHGADPALVVNNVPVLQQAVVSQMFNAGKPGYGTRKDAEKIADIINKYSKKNKKH